MERVKNKRLLSVPGYEVYVTRYAGSILNGHFKNAKAELKEILKDFLIAETDVIKGGGGKSTITQALGKRFDARDWKKRKIELSTHAGAEVVYSQSHEVDHLKNFSEGTIGVEVEWNTKDTFFDRDLENFRRLHQTGVLSIGIIVTRGSSLQAELQFVIERALSELTPYTLPSISKLFRLSDKAKTVVRDLMQLLKTNAIKEIAKFIYNSKFGKTTTHMAKLLLRLDRGVGDPCPFILIGIGKERLTC